MIGFIPLREPWRNGVVEHFNDVWDKAFFRTETFNSLGHLRQENAAFVAFHNAHHRYSAHAGATPDQMWQDRLPAPLSTTYQPPTRLPAQGRIEVVRYIRSNRRLDLFGKRITVAEDHTHQYVTAIIKVRSSRSSSSTSTARSSTTAPTNSPGSSDNPLWNDVQPETASQQRNDVLPEPHLHPKRNDVLSVKT